MYDSNNERHEFVGEDRADAVAKACDFYEVDEANLKVSELKAGEIYGLANRAVVVAELLDRKPPEGGGGGGGRRDGGRDRGDRGGRGDRGDRGGRGDRGDRGGRGRGDGGRGDGGRERGGRGEGGRGRAEASDRGRPEPDRDREEPEHEEPSGPSVGTAEGEVGEVGQFLIGAIERMDLGPFTLSESAEDELLAFRVSGEAAPRLAGSDGRPVDALQLLASQAAGQISDEPPRVVLDVEGDADARELRMGKLAQRVAGRARETGRAVRLDPMNGSDRRLIHLALKDEDDVATMSTGEGRYRQVVVVPEGAPEYEDARRDAERAAERVD